jgi:hypothetical protein
MSVIKLTLLLTKCNFGIGLLVDIKMADIRKVFAKH